MSINNPNIDDTSPIYIDFMRGTPPSLNTDKIDKIFDDLKTDFDNSTWLVRNADVVFKCASINLQRMTVVCITASLLIAIGGLGTLFCKRGYKKTRLAFTCLTIAGAVLPLFAAFTLFHMYTKASTYSGFFERRWS